MRIGVLGTGMVGRALAGRLADLGHDVAMGTRDVDETLARAQPDRPGHPTVASWLAERPSVRLVGFAEAAAGAEVIIHATAGSAALGVLERAGADNLAGKVLVDVSNPLDLSGSGRALLVSDDDSLAEQIQRAFPAARVVKSLNTMNAVVMVDPRNVAAGAHSVFVSGDDESAKATVTGLLHGLGHTDVIDLGGLTTARGAEMVLPLWIALRRALGTADFNFKIAR